MDLAWVEECLLEWANIEMRVKRTIPIPESDEVMAMFREPAVSYKGKWQDINIVKISKQEYVPLDIRESLVGLTIPTIFSKEKLESQGISLPIPVNSRIAYADDVVNVLEDDGKFYLAEQLKKIYPKFLDMYVFEGGIYDLV